MELEINKMYEKFINVEIKQHTPKSPIIQKGNHKRNEKIFWDKCK